MKIYSGIPFTCFLGAIFCFMAACQDIPKCPAPTLREYSLHGFDKISASDEFIFTITRSTEKRTKLVAKGCAADLDDLRLTVSDSLMEMRYKKFRKNRHVIEFEIITPVDIDVSFFKSVRIYRKDTKS